MRTDQEDVEAFALSIPSHGPEAAHAHGGSATLSVAVDEAAAEDEFVRCESAIRLTCYRVANAVLLVHVDDPATLLRIETAVRAMESE